MSILQNKVKLNKEVNYIGSPLGWPMYINTAGVTDSVKITISGGVEYPHFIYGSTSKSELERMLEEAKGLIFDLEIPGIIRFSLPSTYILIIMLMI